MLFVLGLVFVGFREMINKGFLNIDSNVDANVNIDEFNATVDLSKVL